MSVSVGESDACAVRTAGRVACWGRGVHGELGNGFFYPSVAEHEGSAVPVEVAGH